MCTCGVVHGFAQGAAPASPLHIAVANAMVATTTIFFTESPPLDEVFDPQEGDDSGETIL
jgi:hypothetical protein